MAKKRPKKEEFCKTCERIRPLDKNFFLFGECCICREKLPLSQYEELSGRRFLSTIFLSEKQYEGGRFHSGEW